MQKGALVTREEAHWSSFRRAVVGFQHSILLEDNASAPADERWCMYADEIIISDGDGGALGGGSKPQRIGRDTLAGTHDRDNGANTANIDARRLNAVADDEQSQRSGGKHTETANTQQRLELIGLEEVDKSFSGNNPLGSKGITSPAHAPSQASQALSIAEHQLAETKLKLAVTESERDELEFRLLQSNPR